MKLKRLIAPCLVILASLALCMGTTYALFTSREDNNIATTSGKVKLTSTIEDLELYSPTAINLDGTIKDDTNCATATHFFNGGTASISHGKLSLINITPGDKVSFKIKFNNQSNVSIKYHVLCDDITEYSGTETHKLIDVLKVKEGSNVIKYGYPLRKWTQVEPNQAIEDILISVELPSDVEKAYCYLASKLAFSVEAVQANAYVTDGFAAISTSVSGSGYFSVTSFDYLIGKKIKFERIGEGTTESLYNMAVKDDNGNILTTLIRNNEHVTSVAFSVDYGGGVTESLFNWSVNGGDFTPVEYTVTGDVTICASCACCVLEGTEITMGDLSKKKVEDLRYGDMILSYNFRNGEYESTPVVYTYDETDYAEIFKVTLDNGNSINVVNCEDMFDVNTKMFFTISCDTYEQCVGKEVLTHENGNKQTGKIVDIEYSFERCTRYTVYSEGNLNYVASDIVMLYSVNGFNEKYTITNDLTIDQIAYEKDVAAYGLFTYDDLPMLDKYMFDSFDIATCTFLVGKGYLTMEQLIDNINEFVLEYTEKYPIFINK